MIELKQQAGIIQPVNKTIADTHPSEKAAQFVWTAVILSFFLIQAIIWTIAITFTANDKSHAVVPGYDEKALNWDDEVATRAASARLGWLADLAVASMADIRGNRAITLSLCDVNQRPISGAQIEMSAFHRGRAGDPQTVAMRELAAGIYSGQIQVQKSGLWQFDGTVRHEGDLFLIHQITSIVAVK